MDAAVELIRSLSERVEGAKEFFRNATTSLLVGYAARALGTGLTGMDVDRRVIVLMGVKESGKSFLIKRLRVEGLRERNLDSKYVADWVRPILAKLGLEVNDAKELRKQLIRLVMRGPVAIEPVLIKVHEINAVGGLDVVLDKFTQLLDDGATELFSQDLVVPIPLRVKGKNYSFALLGVQPRFVSQFSGAEWDERMSDRVVVLMLQNQLRGVVKRAPGATPSIVFPKPPSFDGDLVRYFLDRLYEHRRAEYRLETMLFSFKEMSFGRKLALLAKARWNTASFVDEEEAFLAMLALEPLRGVVSSLVDFEAFGSRYKRVDRDFLDARGYWRYPVQPLDIMMREAGIDNRKRKVALGGPLGKQIKNLRKSGYVAMVRYKNRYRLLPSGRLRAFLAAVIREAKIDVEDALRMNPSLKPYIDAMKELLRYLYAE